MWRYGLNTARSLTSYHREKIKLNHYPFIQGIEVTAECNLNCQFCKRDRVEQRGTGYMNQETFHNVVNEENRRMLRHTRLFMHGEPLLHKDLPEYVAEAQKYAKTVGLTTNGTLLTADYSQKLLEAGLTAICFSGHTSNIAGNIKAFLELKQQINPSCHVTLAVIDPYEIEYLPELKMPGLDEVLILPVHDWGLTGTRKDVCLWPWWGLTVYWNGDVAPCCLYESPGTFGNINEQSISEIWNSEPYQQLRRDMLSGEACQTCSISNRTLNESFLHVHSPNLWALPSALLRMGVASLK